MGEGLIMEEFIKISESDYILTVVLSIAIIWGIGLTPPILIRYVFLRKPIDRKPAIIIVSVFWFINLFIFLALGSRSKTHTALFLVAIASYYILRRWVEPDEQLSKNQNTQIKPNTYVKCKGCGKLLSDAQAAYMLNNPKYSEWCRNGYCCLSCFEEK